MIFQAPRVVFPFHGGKFSLSSYAWAKELAGKVHLPFYVFCALSPENLFSKIHIYHEMLEADGYYFTHYPGHASDKTHVRIKTGDFLPTFQRYLQCHPSDIVVVDQRQDFSDVEHASGLMAYPNGLIFLRSCEGITQDNFSHILANAEIHHLPSDFYLHSHRGGYVSKLLRNWIGREN